MKNKGTAGADAKPANGIRLRTLVFGLSATLNIFGGFTTFSGKRCIYTNGKPRDNTERRLTYLRSTIRRLVAIRPPPDARPDEPLTPSRGWRLPGALATGGDLRPGRRADAEPDDEVQVQADQGEDQPGDREHVQRVELAQRIGADLLPSG